MWLKYHNSPIMSGEQWDRAQSGHLSRYEKPCGFWITDDTEYCWRSWCVAEGFGMENLTHKHAVDLDESNILIMRSPYELDAFTREFRVDHWWGPDEQPRKWRDVCIDWRAVSARYAGIIITPYQWQRRMHDSYSWYYGWDCASGCIWRGGAIKGIRLIEIDLDVVKAGEKEAA